ncbi:MAG: ankyrin repeat domain-containing protein [Deltaproteobacteria bacterium]|nr:ankyrin repeat domain-containing protein [Deltaproteobacteria bacterium]
MKKLLSFLVLAFSGSLVFGADQTFSESSWEDLLESFSGGRQGEQSGKRPWKPSYKRGAEGRSGRWRGCGPSFENESSTVQDSVVKRSKEDLVDQYGRTPLHRAVMLGDLAAVISLVENGANVNKADVNGMTPLGLAICFERSDVIQFLVDQGAGLDVADRSDSVALHCAENRSDSHADVVTSLVAAGEDVHKVVYDAKTTHSPSSGESSKESTVPVSPVLPPEFRSGLSSSPETDSLASVLAALRELTFHPEPVKKRRDFTGMVQDAREAGCAGRTRLHQVAANGNLAAVEAFVAAGEGVHQADKDGRTPLHIAAANGNLAAIEVLVAAGAEINQADKDDRSPLHMATANENLMAMKILSMAGAEVNQADKDGRTSLHWAAAIGDLDAVKVLVAAGAELNQTDKDGRSPLDFLNKNKHLEVFDFLSQYSRGDAHKADDHDAASSGPEKMQIRWDHVQECRSDDHQINDEFMTPLIEAAKNGCLDTVTSLVMECEAEVNEAGSDGMTPLLIAVHFGHSNIVKFLVEQGAVVDQPDHSGATPLLIAASFGALNIVKFLVERGAAVDTVDRDGYSPLMMAAFWGHSEVIKFLVQTGKVDVNKIANDGKTALLWAQAMGCRDSAGYLEECMKQKSEAYTAQASSSAESPVPAAPAAPKLPVLPPEFRFDESLSADTDVLAPMLPAPQELTMAECHLIWQRNMNSLMP